jgi:hypothetical protein
VRAADAIRLAGENGVRLSVDETYLLVNWDGEGPPPQLVDALKQNKPEIIALLNERERADWLAFYDERAGIAEYDGQQTRKQAEATAGECCVIEWLNQHPEPSDPDSCAGCNKPGSQCLVVPFLAGDGSHTWLHPECWEAWHQARRRKAVSALNQFGINAG